MKLHDVVKLKDGRTATIVEMFETVCDVDVGDSPENWDTITVNKNDIKEVLWTSTQ